MFLASAMASDVHARVGRLSVSRLEFFREQKCAVRCAPRTCVIRRFRRFSTSRKYWGALEPHPCGHGNNSFTCLALGGVLTVETNFYLVDFVFVLFLVLVVRLYHLIFVWF